MAYRENAPVTLGQVKEMMLAQKDWQKNWFQNNVDTFDIMKEIKRIATSTAHRNTESMSTTDVVRYNNIAVLAIYTVLQEAGVDVNNLPLADVPMTLQSITQIVGCFNLDANGVKWTAAQWAAYVDEHGEEPAPLVGILVNNNTHPFIVAKNNIPGPEGTGLMMFGTYNHMPQYTEAYGGSGIKPPYSGEENCIRWIQYADPNLLKNTDKWITYSAGMTVEDCLGKRIIAFASQAERDSWAQSVGLVGLVQLGNSPVYIWPHASVQNAWVVSYFSGSNSIAFTTKEAQVPYTDNYGILGPMALRLCMEYKPFAEDDHNWRLMSVYEGFVQFLMADQIDECLRACNGTMLDRTNNQWTSQPSGATYEYYISLGSGSISSNYKNTKFGVRAVSSYRA